MWNGPSTVDSVAPLSAAVVDRLDQHRDPQHVGEQDELLAQSASHFCPVSVRKAIAAVPLRPGQLDLLDERMQVLDQRAQHRAQPRVGGVGDAAHDGVAGVVLGEIGSRHDHDATGAAAVPRIWPSASRSHCSAAAGEGGAAACRAATYRSGRTSSTPESAISLSSAQVPYGILDRLARSDRHDRERPARSRPRRPALRRSRAGRRCPSRG